MKGALAFGLSQSARLLRDFVYQGFNADEQGRIVFDGMFASVAGGRLTDVNVPFGVVSKFKRQHEERNYIGAQFPFTYPTLYDPISNKTDGIMQLCSQTRTCPKFMHQDSDVEVWNGMSSLVATDTLGNHVEMPDNVRIYMISGQNHGPGDGTPRDVMSYDLKLCKLQTTPVDGAPVIRALVADLDQWAFDGVAPPPSMFPNKKEGTLQTIKEAKAAWPRIPGFPFNERIAPGEVFSNITTPPSLQYTYPVYVAKSDANGTGIGGIITPDLAAPIGTYFGRNFRIAGHAEDELCIGQGGYIPLPATRAERDRSGDSRLSVEELYPGGAADFYARRRAQVERLIAMRLVLPEEAEGYVSEVKF
jgi:hypothetical protein